MNDKKIESSTEKQYVTFKLAQDIFGIEVMKVKEVLYLVEITHLPNTAPYMRGVIDLRGTVVPLVDLRIKFNLPERNYDDETVILIIESHSMLIGFIVDQVFDVMSLTMEKYHQTPHFTEAIEHDSVDGIAQNEANNLIVLLNVEKIFSLEDIQGLNKQHPIEQPQEHQINQTTL